ncbi:MAG: EF2563 family selenium-dependent molybdenum hydroxylase system protein [Thermoanaerobacterales bacterium]|nr:EF2563 family selenium-dependent molybdenum hydroxylase system protein [Thermoanaerobacterales bacterium]
MIAIVRGGGDLATGIIYRLWKVGFKVLCLEVEKPLVIRRTVSAAQAIYEGSYTIEDMCVKHIDTVSQFTESQCKDPCIIIDPQGKSIPKLRPEIVIDAIMAKNNIGTHIKMADIVVGAGPGFYAGKDVHAVVETKRGHYLGRVIYDGCAMPNSGIPGIIMGYGKERVIYATSEGPFVPEKQIGDHVEADDIIGSIGEVKLRAPISGVIRGLIHESIYITKGLKMADIDPRGERDHCFTISDKALSVGGGVLEAVFCLAKDRNLI